MDPPHGPGFIAVREVSLDQFPAFFQQPFSITALHSATIRIHRRLLVHFASPVAPPPLRLRQIASRLRPPDTQNRLVTVITLVGHNPGKRCLADPRLPCRCAVRSVPDECRYVLESLGAVYGFDAEARGRRLTLEERLTFSRHAARR